MDSPAIESFRLQLRQLRVLAELRQTLERRAHALLQDRPDFQHLCSLPGVASALAMVILAEGGDLRPRLDLANCQSSLAAGSSSPSPRKGLKDSRRLSPGDSPHGHHGSTGLTYYYRNRIISWLRGCSPR